MNALGLRHAPRWFVRVVFLIVLVLAVGMLLVPLRVVAQEVPLYVHERPEVTVRLMPGPCVDGVSAMMIATAPQQYRGDWRAIESNWLMRDGSRMDFAGCWLELSAEKAADLSSGRLLEAAFLLVFSDQTASAIPKREFLKRRGQMGL